MSIAYCIEINYSRITVKFNFGSTADANRNDD